TADGYFTLIAVNSGKCLDDSGMSLAEGAAVIQWACWGGDNQKWSIKQ
ncbi:MAG: Beta-agarase AgaB34, partial [Bryobacterales bacterium]|nr:Beta-agarase AgaB34 [Bryobacterales bacterium]